MSLWSYIQNTPLVTMLSVDELLMVMSDDNQRRKEQKQYPNGQEHRKYTRSGSIFVLFLAVLVRICMPKVLLKACENHMQTLSGLH